MEEWIEGWQAEAFILAKECADHKQRIAELEADLARMEKLMMQLERGSELADQTINELLEQRDRLAEALTKIHNLPIRDGFSYFGSVYDLTKEALASLDQSSSPHTKQTPAEHEDND